MAENWSKERIEEIKGRMRAVGIEPIFVGNEDIRREMSEDEKKELDAEIRQHTFEEERLENEKKDAMKTFKDALDKQNELRLAKAHLREKGYHDVNVKCIMGVDSNRGVVSIVDITTGKEAGTRMIKDSDLQTKMEGMTDDETPSQEPEAPKEPEAIGIGFEGNRGEGPVDVEGVVVEDDTPLIEEGEVTHTVEEAVDMIRSIEEKGAAWLIEAVDKTYFTEDAEIVQIAQQVIEAKCYATIKFVDIGTRNAKAVGIEPRVVEEPTDDIQLPEGMESVEDID